MPGTVPDTGNRELIKQTSDRQLTFWGKWEKTVHKQFQTGARHMKKRRVKR